MIALLEIGTSGLSDDCQTKLLLDFKSLQVISIKWSFSLFSEKITHFYSKTK